MKTDERTIKQESDIELETICEIEAALRNKINEMIPMLESLPPAQPVTSTQGEEYLKPNPALAEIRATMRDYLAVVKAKRDLTGGKVEAAEVVSIDAIRKKLKIAK